jgi:[protein-PII] uridylyltransferase
MNMPNSEKVESFFSPELLTDSGIPYDRRRVMLLEASRRFLEHHQARIRAQHSAGVAGRITVGSLTSLTDTLIRNLYRSVSADLPEQAAGSCALIAIGGYGRGELNPRSDVDVMFYYSGKTKKLAEQISERMLYLLWDLGLDVGYSVRTAKDCLEMAERDITARTALLDSRFLVGDDALYREYETSVLEPVLNRNTQAFIREKLEENTRRLQKYGSSVFLLEPNIKEGEGGLRDLHTAIWVARVKFKSRTLRDLVIKAVLTEREAEQFEEAFDFLWRIRNELHYISGARMSRFISTSRRRIAHFSDAPTTGAGGRAVHAGLLFPRHRVEHLASSLITKATQQDESSFRILGYLTRRSSMTDFMPCAASCVPPGRTSSRRIRRR